MMKGVPSLVELMRFILYLLVAAALLMLFILPIIDYVSSKYPTISYWVDYGPIDVGSVYPVGAEKITVETFSNWKQDNIYTTYSSVLFCMFSDDKWIKEDFSKPYSTTRNKKNNTDKPVRWKLRINLPLEPAKCYIRHSVTINTRYGPRNTKVNSNVFDVVELIQ